MRYKPVYHVLCCCGFIHKRIKRQFCSPLPYPPTKCTGRAEDPSESWPPLPLEASQRQGKGATLQDKVDLLRCNLGEGWARKCQSGGSFLLPGLRSTRLWRAEDHKGSSGYLEVVTQVSITSLAQRE